jgi:hypothetical protein
MTATVLVRRRSSPPHLVQYYMCRQQFARTVLRAERLVLYLGRASGLLKSHGNTERHTAEGKQTDKTSQPGHLHPKSEIIAHAAGEL